MATDMQHNQAIEEKITVKSCGTGPGISPGENLGSGLVFSSCALEEEEVDVGRRGI